MNPAVTAGELLGVWDTRDQYSLWWLAGRPEANNWATGHIVDADSTYRVEFRLLDGPYAVVWRYKRNSDGRCYVDPETDQIAKAEPVIQALDELPPAHLLGH